MLMPEVDKCTVDSCFYNNDNMCHANAITVGSPCPKCDTFVASDNHGDPALMGLVGACHESDCKFNLELSCAADGIEVGCHQDHPDCKTYSPVQ